MLSTRTEEIISIHDDLLIPTPTGGRTIFESCLDRLLLPPKQQQQQDQFVVISGDTTTISTLLTQSLAKKQNENVDLIYLNGRFHSKQEGRHRKEPLSAWNCAMKQLIKTLQSPGNENLLKTIRQQLKDEFQNNGDGEDEYLCLVRTFPELKVLFPTNMTNIVPQPTTDLWVVSSPLVFSAWKQQFLLLLIDF